MLTRLRRQFKLISYYSATRQRTIWSRVLQWAALAALIAALPLVITTEALVVRAANRRSEIGVLGQEPGGPVEATWHGDGIQDHPPRPFGEWALKQSETRRGWPFPSTRRRERLRLELNLFDEAGSQFDIQLAADDPRRVAIEAALEAGGRHDLVTAWRSIAAPEEDRAWLGTMASAMVWWLGLSCVALVTIRLLAFGTKITNAYRSGLTSTRAASGRCPSCNYDMRGLEWAERCPECGALSK